MLNFKINDKVIYINQKDITFHNKIGKIIFERDYDILIEFDENIHGHDGYNENIKCKNNHGWYFQKNEMSKYFKILTDNNHSIII